MVLSKIGFLFTILFMASIINVSWLPKTLIMATRDIERDLSGFGRRLLPELNTCLRSCTPHSSDCSDCWVCCACMHNALLGNVCG
ncbi:hypothetical protein A4A49_44117 [Nicotiana attenuata]|uniref:Carboxypeptidase A inhibitor-like domain-containing protein n=1 Tax=Nicotiana attenuata TaxID=49451 RepID=A0A1J6KIN8_NICAT|nr:hypothetical protein A4A49_44117 [Nicotiana attenuata]